MEPRRRHDKSTEHFDVLIVGAGLSGIGAACRLQTRCPDQRFAILEARDRSGGTWDLFRYPGVRSDSDMFTLGYPFRPWTGAKAIADGPAILAYLRDTAREHGIDRHIRFGHRVVRADWSSERAAWTVEVERDGGREPLRFSCGLLFMCSGYYRYDEGYAPAFPGAESFAGRIVHPQQWPDDLEVAGKRIVVIGSGATAVTLVPALAAERRAGDDAAALADLDGVAAVRGPTGEAAAPLAAARPGATPSMRWQRRAARHVLLRPLPARPARARQLLLGGVRALDGPGPTARSALHAALRPVATAPLPGAGRRPVPRRRRAAARRSSPSEIERFTADRRAPGRRRGDRRRPDRHRHRPDARRPSAAPRSASTARPVDWPGRLAYKGTMFSDVPNLVSVFGYTNASWTLKSDLISEWVCRLLAHLRRSGMRQATPMQPRPGGRPGRPGST